MNVDELKFCPGSGTFPFLSGCDSSQTDVASQFVNFIAQLLGLELANFDKVAPIAQQKTNSDD